jgi:Domain of unknown function (DUF4268)
MYSREEVIALKKEFWEGFGVYCSQVSALRKRKSKFMLYNTKMKGIEMKFDATRDGAYVILEFNHKDEDIRLRHFTYFEQYKSLFEKDFSYGLIFELVYIRECGTQVSRMYTHLSGIDIHRRVQWLAFYEFMASEMLKLEKAFRLVKEVIE